jgi:hypothetical protein
MANFDLHLHSRASDGAADLATLRASIAARPELALVALADHDTIADSVTLAATCPRALTAVELTAELRGPTRGRSAPHLLGYGFDPADPGLIAYLETRSAERQARIQAWSERLTALGLRFEIDPVVAATSAVGKSQVVAELRRHPENLALLPPAPSEVGVSDPIYTNLLKRGGAADIDDLVPSALLPLPEAIALLHGAGGLAILAHPRVSLYELGQDRRRADWRAGAIWARTQLRAWATEPGLDGLEVFTPRQDPEFVAELLAMAGELDLLVSAGSDDHSADLADLGTAFEGATASESQTEAWLTAIRERLAKR